MTVRIRHITSVVRTDYYRGLIWQPNEVKVVDDEHAKQLLVHTDTWVKAGALKKGETVTPLEEKLPQAKKPIDEPFVVLHLDGMKTAQELVTFARNTYGEVLDVKLPIPDLKRKILAIHTSGLEDIGIRI